MRLVDHLRAVDMRRDWRVMLVGVGCAYEVVALMADDERIPPLTHIAWRLRTDRFGRFLLWLLFGWLIEHIFGEGR